MAEFGGLHLSPSDLLHLTREEQTTIIRLVRKIDAAKKPVEEISSRKIEGPADATDPV